MGLLDTLRGIVKKTDNTPPWNTPDDGLYNEKALTAVRSVTDEKQLFEIAISATSIAARAMATHIITNEEMLLQLSHALPYSVRLACAGNSHFKNIARLTEMALHDRDSLVRAKAIARIDDEMIVAQAIVKEKAEPYEKYAGGDQSDGCDNIRTFFGKIVSTEALFHIAKNRRDSGQYDYGFRDHGTDEWVWATGGFHVIDAAIERINDQNLLKRLAVEAAFEGARKAALAKVDDPEFVRKITAQAEETLIAESEVNGENKLPAQESTRQSSRQQRQQAPKACHQKAGKSTAAPLEEPKSVTPPASVAPPVPAYPGKRKGVAIALWFVGFFGYLNLHNFYLGKTKKGLLALAAYVGGTAAFMAGPDTSSLIYKALAFFMAGLFFWNCAELIRLMRTPKEAFGQGAIRQTQGATE
ncbi:TM2 domain-containing protein [Desulfovibrio sp. OttesenSCG-928-C06]|nr:TM2 domain-containing protein [Desulfovibrio sp. OttesenSCG-928-C06]